jgi:transcriptional regulator with XRE-family HTH domain
MLGVRDRFRERRLAANLSKEGLAKRSGVTLGSLKRFEATGLIAFDSLLKLALVLDCLGDFEKIGANDPPGTTTRSLDQILAAKRTRRKGWLK